MPRDANTHCSRCAKTRGPGSVVDFQQFSWEKCGNLGSRKIDNREISLGWVAVFRGWDDSCRSYGA